MQSTLTQRPMWAFLLNMVFPHSLCTHRHGGTSWAPVPLLVLHRFVWIPQKMLGAESFEPSAQREPRYKGKHPVAGFFHILFKALGLLLYFTGMRASDTAPSCPKGPCPCCDAVRAATTGSVPL